ncbi:MAG: 3-hydroxyacyl-CoA dehydrogenase [Caldilineaceae bacterium]|nr:3-hydroxyacyl-CoA dehydrogenase [Caldilineaceae bacterium]HRJ43757.1 3-hydroxyacyl-CoA dehydrogenase [Caldilineaceae bacterium]
MDLHNSTILITGGGSGLGAATARLLANGGANVVLADMNREAGEATAAAIGAQAQFARVDVVNEEEVQAAIDGAVAEFGGLHGLVNCAGIAIAERVLGRSTVHDLGHFAAVIAVNLTGTFNCIRLAAAAMARNEPNGDGERGVIVNTASVAAFDGQIGQAAYAASKGGVVAMTLPIARELARSGIRVCTIAPGIMDTPMLAGLPEAARKSLGEQVPFPARLGSPDEYAALVQHIFSNAYLNGEVIRLDGGIRMAPR